MALWEGGGVPGGDGDAITPREPPVVVALALVLVTGGLPVGLPEAAAVHEEERSLRPSEEVRDLERKWLTDTFFEVRNTTIRRDFQPSQARNLSATVNESFQAWRDDRWRDALQRSLSARIDTAVLRIDQDANRSDDPSGVWLNETAAIASDGAQTVAKARTRISDLANNTTNPRRMEVLVLSATLVVDALENLRVYPQARDIVRNSGNETPSAIFRQLASHAVSARWDGRWASDLVDLAENMSASAEGDVRVDPGRLPDAWATMEASLDLGAPSSPAEEGILQGINATTRRGEWVTALALGEAYGSAQARGSLTNRLRQGALQPNVLADQVRSQARNLGPVLAMRDLGYSAVLQIDAARGAEATLTAEEDVGRLALAQARLENTALLGHAMGEMVVAASDDDGEVQPPGQDGGASEVLVGGLGLLVGIAAGAGVAWFSASRRD